MVNKFVSKIITIISITCCSIILVLNILFSARIMDDISEVVTIKFSGIFKIIITLIIVGIILILSEKVNKFKISRKVKLILLSSFLVIYVLLQVCWINVRQATPSFDQKEVYSVAVKIYEGNLKDLENSQYLELYPQQLTLANTYALIFKIFGITSVKLIQYINALANAFTIIMILLITKQLGIKYNTNITKAFILIATFVTLPLLSTFVYGDIISMPFSLGAIYFAIKYGIEHKKRYILSTGICMSIAYILRMNNLIYIIALFIYFILNLFRAQRTNYKEILKQILLIILFIILSVVPCQIIKLNMQKQLELNPEHEYPKEGFLYMGMETSYRANGWYSEYGDWAWEEIEGSKERYKVAIKERLNYFIHSPIEFIEFYAKKIASMWTENTYAGLWYNQTYNFGFLEDDNIKVEEMKQLDEKLQKTTEKILIYQKAVVIAIFISTIAAIIKNRESLSNEMILLIIVFIGGFLFHILWEAKSRYIISYILILIPLASMWNLNIKKMEE